MALFYNIAGLTLSVSGTTEENLLRDIMGFPVFLSASQKPDFEVRFGVLGETVPSTPATYDFQFSDTEVSCSFGHSCSRYWFRMEPSEGSPVLLIYEEGSSLFEATHCSDPSLLRFLLWMAFGMYGATRQRVPIHSSVIVNQGKAVLFLGESGTGKSTHTRLWLKHIPRSRLLNDDSPILRIEDGKTFVCGSPWSGKTPCFHNLQFPVAAFVRLRQAPYNRITPLPVLQSFSALQPSFPPALSREDYFLEHYTRILSQMLATVPVYRLECLPDEAAAWLSYNTTMNNP